jgi:hypothetical protein
MLDSLYNMRSMETQQGTYFWKMRVIVRQHNVMLVFLLKRSVATHCQGRSGSGLADKAPFAADFGA